MSPQVYSVNDFCTRFGICRATLYNLLRRGEGPAAVKIGRCTFIPVKAAEEWLDKLQSESRLELPR